MLCQNPPPHLFHALSSMSEWMHKCMKNEKGKENVTSRWWLDWAKRCYPIKIMWWFTELTFVDLFPIYIMTTPIWIGLWKIRSWNLFPLHDQSWKIITESSWSTPMFNKRMWLGGMVDLGSRMIGSGINTNSKKINFRFESQFWFKSWAKSKN